jgi:GxxExxY protein
VTIADLTFQIIGAAIEVHTGGPGLNEKTYDACFGDHLTTLGLQFEHQIHIPVMRHGRRLQSTFRLEYVVRKAVIVALKAVHSIHPVHVAHLRPYLKVTGLTWASSSTSTSYISATAASGL